MRFAATALVVAVVTLSATAPRAAHADARFTVNAGFPEVFGVGYGQTVTDDHRWRLQGDVGLALFVNTLTFHVQHLFLRTDSLGLGLDAHGALLWIPAIIGEYPESDTDEALGMRAVLDLGHRSGITFAMEFGFDYWFNIKERDRDESPWQPSVVLRLGGSWEN